MTRMTSNDIEALAVMVEVFGTQQLLDVLEAIAICRALYSGGAPLNSVQARINRDAKAAKTENVMTNRTITQDLLTRSYGDVTHTEVKTAGGNLVEIRGNYAFYEMEDGSRIAVPYVPFDREAKTT